MGWGNWLGFGSAFQELGQALGPDRLKNQMAADRLAMEQEEADRKSKEFEHLSSLWSFDKPMAEATLAGKVGQNELTEEQTKGARLDNEWKPETFQSGLDLDTARRRQSESATRQTLSLIHI